MDNTQDTTQEERSGQEGVQKSQETPIREQDWKIRCKDARDMALNPNIGGMTFKQIGELIQIEEEHEFFATFGDFLLQNKAQPEY